MIYKKKEKISVELKLLNYIVAGNFTIFSCMFSKSENFNRRWEYGGNKKY